MDQIEAMQKVLSEGLNSMALTNFRYPHPAMRPHKYFDD